MARRSRSRRSRSLAALGLATALAPACYRAPTLTGSDQVHDPNIEVTAIKDNALAAGSWPVVDNAMNALVGGANLPGCAIGVARAGELVYLQGYGKAVLGGEDWGVGTMSAVGSVSKTFTAAAAMRADQLGWLQTTTDEVGDFLATGNAALAGTRIEDLLDQSSGVGGATQGAAFSPTWEPGSNAAACASGAPIDCLAVARTLAEPRLAFAQYEGTEVVSALGGGVPQQGVYSNVGYSVLGAVLDDIAQGTSYSGYEQLVWHEVGNRQTPIYHADNMLSLALSHSWRGTDIPHRASGYAPSGGGGYALFEAFDPAGLANVEGWEGPAGGWLMTIGDLTRFTVALNTSQIVDAGRLGEMRAVRTNLDGFGEHYGFGLFHGTGSNAPYWHGGQIGGHTAAWMWWPSAGGQSLGIAMMCNRNDISAYTLRGTATSLAGPIASSAPVAAPPIAPPAIGVSGAAGRTWALGTAGAFQAQPRDVIAPLTSLAYDLVLSSRVTSTGRLALTLSEAKVAGGTYVPATGRTPLDLGEVAFSGDPWFSTRPRTARLLTPFGEVVVSELAIRGAVTSGGGALSRVSVSGTLDARQLAGLGTGSATAMCAQVANTDAACVPCPDGAVACKTVRFEHLDGRRVVP